MIEQSNVTIIIPNSIDLDRKQLNYNWKQKSCKSVALENSTTVLAHFIAPTIERNNTDLVFELTIEDDKGAYTTRQYKN
jgi:hypothetical protein